MMPMWQQMKREPQVHEDRSFDNADPSGKSSYVFLERYGNPIGGGKGILVSNGFCPTLTGTVPYVCVEEYKEMEDLVMYENHPADSRISESVGISPTLTSRMGTGGNNVPMYIEKKEDKKMSRYVVRRVTPKECERLQGFPDDYTDVPWNGSEHSPDSRRYKALGNSMAVPVMRKIAERIDLAFANPIKEDTSTPVDWQPDLF